MDKRQSNEIYRDAWGNHILNAMVGTILVVIVGYLLKVWEIPLFWVFGLFAVVLAIFYDRIPKRQRWLKVTIMLTLPMIAIIYARAGVNQYLLVDASIFLILTELLKYFRDKSKKRSMETYLR